MNASLMNNIRLLFSELFKYRTALISVFVFISFTILGTGLVWPKRFESYVTIQVNEKDVIQPLMQGSAVATNIADISKNAKTLITSRKVVEDVLVTTGYVSKNTSAEKREKLINKVNKRTIVKSVGQNLIRISYLDENPELAMKGAQRFADLFLEESKSRKNDESIAAFEFIDKQVGEYHQKLVEAEKKLKEFRSEHLDAVPGSENQISTEMNRLQRRLEESTLAYKEEKIRYESLKRQLSGESEVVVGITHEGQIRKRIADLQSELDTLRLSYTDTYPDVVQLRYQIEDLQKELDSEHTRKERALANGISSPQDENARTNPLYQELRKSLSDSKTKLATLATRINETKKLLDIEVQRGKRVHGGEAVLSELTRDYEVNRDIYQDLLKRRENARVSKNMESDQVGRMKIYEPAFLPVEPTGIRFLHFMIAGLVLGILIPVGLFYVFQQTDPRIRSVEIIREDLGLPILGVLPVLATPDDIKRKNKNIRDLGLVVVSMITLYFLIGFLRYISVI